MNSTTKRALKSVAFACVLAAASAVTWANDYPTKPIRIIVPFAAGGSADATGRMLADHLRDTWKQTVLVENRAGANALIGTAAVAAAEPDGYTLLLTGVSISTVKVYSKNPGFDVERDLSPVAQLVAGDYLISAAKSAPFDTLPELIRYAKTNPGKLANGSGAGGMFLAFESFKGNAGVDILQVNYKGEAPALTDLAGSGVQLVMSSLMAAKPFLDGDRIKPIAVTSTKRSAILPRVPTAAEGGLPFTVDFWFGLSAPAKTPSDIRNRLAAEVAAWAKKPEVVAKLATFGLFPAPSKPEEFGRFIAAETARYADVAQRAGIKPE